MVLIIAWSIGHHTRLLNLIGLHSQNWYKLIFDTQILHSPNKMRTPNCINIENKPDRHKYYIQTITLVIVQNAITNNDVILCLFRYKEKQIPLKKTHHAIFLTIIIIILSIEYINVTNLQHIISKLLIYE